MKILFYFFVILSCINSDPLHIPNFVLKEKKQHICDNENSSILTYIHKPSGIEFILIRGGDFVMGHDNEYDNPPHKETVEDFLISKYEIKKEIWNKFMPKDKLFKDNEKGSVDSVTWDDAKEFCRKLDFELPREKQWEYVCKKICNHRHGQTNSSKKVVKTKNYYGIFEMEKGLSEWCEDTYYNFAKKKNKKINENVKVYRGGNFYRPFATNCSERQLYHRSVKKFYLGFRVVYNVARNKTSK